MRLSDIVRRLDRIEADRRSGAPTMILSDRPDGDGPEIRLSDWQAWTADGLATVQNGALVVAGPELTPDEWAARHVTMY